MRMTTALTSSAWGEGDVNKRRHVSAGLARSAHPSGSSHRSQSPSHFPGAERGTGLTCVPFSVVTCQEQEAPTHGSLVCAHPLGRFSYNSSCTVSCQEGYLPSSTEAPRCTSSGSWSASPAACNGKSPGPCTAGGALPGSSLLPRLPLTSNVEHFPTLGRALCRF